MESTTDAALKTLVGIIYVNISLAPVQTIRKYSDIRVNCAKKLLHQGSIYLFVINFLNIICKLDLFRALIKNSSIVKGSSLPKIASTYTPENGIGFAPGHWDNFINILVQ
jgi:Mg2+/citrate symporter